METFSALLAICAGNSPVNGEFPSQRPVTRSVDVFFDLSLNKRLSKQSKPWWFETSSCSLWRHRNVIWCAININHNDHPGIKIASIRLCTQVLVDINITKSDERLGVSNDWQRMFVQQRIQANNKENKFCIAVLLYAECMGDRKRLVMGRTFPWCPHDIKCFWLKKVFEYRIKFHWFIILVLELMKRLLLV